MSINSTPSVGGSDGNPSPGLEREPSGFLDEEDAEGIFSEWRWQL